MWQDTEKSTPLNWQRASPVSYTHLDFEEVKERIGLNDEYEEYAIHDYELPVEIDEYTPIEEVNRLCEMVEDLSLIHIFLSIFPFYQSAWSYGCDGGCNHKVLFLGKPFGLPLLFL